MGESLYTIILEYRGGTSVAQVMATDVQGALRTWASNLGKYTGEVVQPKYRRELRQEVEHDVENDGVVALEGLRNAWCTSAVTKGGSALINIVKTRLR